MLVAYAIPCCRKNSVAVDICYARIFHMAEIVKLACLYAVYGSTYAMFCYIYAMLFHIVEIVRVACYMQHRIHDVIYASILFHSIHRNSKSSMLIYYIGLCYILLKTSYSG